MNQLIELINSTWGIVLTAIMGYVVWLLKEQRKERKDENKRRNVNIDGTKIILFYMLQKLYAEYKNLYSKTPETKDVIKKKTKIYSDENKLLYEYNK